MKWLRVLCFLALASSLVFGQSGASSAASPTDMNKVMEQVQQLREALAAQQQEIQRLRDQISANAQTAPQVKDAVLTTTIATAPQQKPAAPAKPTVIAAVAPVRVLPIDSPKREGFIPDIKIGEKVRLKPYGFFKTSVVYDTSSPYGNDFPLPGFIAAPNTNSMIPEFHIKARALRLGTNFEWLDISPNVVVTGKLEFDFEGNFSRTNNRNVSSIRSNAPSFRLGYGRVDWKVTPDTSIFALFGQDWTPFASSTIPNIFETTGAAISFGSLYERNPQVRFGLNHNLGGERKWRIAPEVALVLPADGNLPADITSAGAVVPGGEGIGNQLGYGERQGVDAARPEVEARLVLQFQLDRAPGVAPAQIIFSGVDGERKVYVNASSVPAAFTGAFPHGASLTSPRHGWTAEIQLPTRWATLTSKFYSGSDMRFFFGGELYAEFSDTTGLTGTATAQSNDGASTVTFGLRNGIPVVAQQLSPRSEGGFVNLGLPLSRWANANPAGRNAGWSLNLNYGFDEVLARDTRRLAPTGGRWKSDLAAGNIQYKMNSFVTFVIEESLYRTRNIACSTAACVAGTSPLYPAFDGRPMRDWSDKRSEIGTIFSF